VALGRLLLGVPYAANTLRGGPDRPEELVLRADSLDCMLLLDLLLAGEALFRDTATHADPAAALAEKLIAQRYQGGRIDYRARFHYFSDWIDDGPRCLDAATRLPGAREQTVILNDRGAGRRWLEGLPARPRTLRVAPAKAATLAALADGDLVGFRARAAGLDVSHVGMVLREGGELKLLHASSRAGRVVVEPLTTHPQWPNGLLVLRPAEPDPSDDDGRGVRSP
jgi:hypothetical protein